MQCSAVVLPAVAYLVVTLLLVGWSCWATAAAAAAAVVVVVV
jgi:hypothetical protein